MRYNDDKSTNVGIIFLLLVLMGVAGMVCVQVGIYQGRKMERRDILNPHTESHKEALLTLAEQLEEVNKSHKVAARCPTCHSVQ